MAHAREAEAVDHVLRQAERDHLRQRQAPALVKDAVEVHVHRLARGAVHENVLAVAVAQPHHGAEHRHRGAGAREGRLRREPRTRRVAERAQQPPAERRAVPREQQPEVVGHARSVGGFEVLFVYFWAF